MPTDGPGSCTRLAREAVDGGAGRIIVCGGDGTINEVVNGMAHSRVPLAVLPGGTANVLARELGTPRKMIDAARLLPQYSAVRIALGRLVSQDGLSRYFMAMAGAGFDAHIVHSIDPALKARLGRGAYWVAGFSQFTRRLGQLEAVIDGRRERASFALASRVRNYGGDLEIACGASLLDDALEVVLFQGETAFPYIKYLAGILTGTLKGMRGIRILRAREVEFAPLDSPLWVQVDGEQGTQLPCRVEIVPDAITLLVPPKFLSRFGAAHPIGLAS